MKDTDYSSALLTDLYQLTMAQTYWRQGMQSPATFDLFFRGYQRDRSYYALAGIETALEFLEEFSFTEDDIGYLISTDIFDSEFLEFLSGVKFTGSASAMHEGSIAFAGEPVLEITAPIIEAQIVETFLLNQVMTQTVLLTKAARIVQAAQDKTVVDFSARRTHGQDSADIAARCGAIGGFAGTSNVLAAARHGIPPVGTMAHSFVQSFEDELLAFRAYAEEYPDSTTLLVDTYDALGGVQNAVIVARELERSGHRLKAVRLDSGDLSQLSKKTRHILDEANLGYVQISATGDLDEFRIGELLEDEAPINSFGVGTRFGVSIDAPVASAVYKLASYGNHMTAKLSPGKETYPGPKQVHRIKEANNFVADVIATREEPAPSNSSPLLKTVMEDGQRTRQTGTWKAAAGRLKESLSHLPERYRSLAGPEHYPVTVSENLTDLLRSQRERRS